MFRGVNALSLDAKGRMAMPARYRDRIMEASNGQVVITVDRDHCLLLYTLPEWEQIERKLSALPSLNEAARRLQRLLIGHATDCELDSHGRILLPSLLRKFAEIDKSVMLVGQGNKFEIWNEETWNGLRDRWLQEEIGELPAELGSLSL